MMGGSIGASLQYWLVNHPTISHFEWDPPHTLASSPLFPALAVLSYIAAVSLLKPRRTRSLSLPPSLLRPISASHSLLLLLLSLLMALACTLSSLSLYHPLTLFCFPLSARRGGPLFFWAHVFYLSKYLEFGDTVLILLSGEGGIRRLSFLHVYHHAVVVIVCYVWLQTAQSLFPLAFVTNASVHVLMYAYYLSAALGWRWPPRWKRAVTDVQIMQFVFSFAASVVMLYLHFVGEGCSGFYGWCFNAVFNASLLALFFDFHSKNYRRRKAEKDKE